MKIFGMVPADKADEKQHKRRRFAAGRTLLHAFVAPAAGLAAAEDAVLAAGEAPRADFAAGQAQQAQAPAVQTVGATGMAAAPPVTVAEGAAPALATAAGAALPAAKAQRADARAKFRTTVGGQAVMEGVMMKGPEHWALSVRTPDGNITTETHDSAPKRAWAKWPVVRGVFAFIDSIMTGYKTLMRSAELAMTEEEQEASESKFDKFMDRHFGDAGVKVVMGIAAVLGIGLAVGLFMFLPTFLVKQLDAAVSLGFGKSLMEGLIKIVLFVAYLALVSRMNDIRRVFRYHGAEHKTIACYEAGDDLTVDNVRRHTRFHPRCGTSFLLIVLILSILVFSLLPWSGTLLRVGLKLLFLPVVMGLAYEVIRLAGRYSNPLTRAVSAPGMWLQRLTTAEPDDEMIEVALAAVAPVLPAKPEEAKW